MATPRKRPEDLKTRGVESTYTPELADYVCMRVATNDVGLPTLCKRYSDMPSEETIRRWQYQFPEFRGKYAQAKIIQADLLAESCINISDDESNDTTVNSNGDTVGLSVSVARATLKTNTRKWLASKLMPKVYGGEAELGQEKEKNALLQAELMELRAKLDEANRKDY